jgi:hypothetical protein
LSFDATLWCKKKKKKKKKTHGLLFSHAFVEARAGYTAAAAASPYKQVISYKTCLSHTLEEYDI